MLTKMEYHNATTEYKNYMKDLCMKLIEGTLEDYITENVDKFYV